VFQELSLLRSAIRARELLGLLYSAELDAPILPREDPRWGRLRSGLDPGVNLRDRFRGALVGSAIKDATGRAIGALGRHDDWIAEFKEKYGLYPEMGI